MSDTSTKTPDGQGMATRFPTAYTILFGLIIVVAALTWIIPAGQYDRAMNEEVGREIAVPGTYHATLTVGDWSMTQSFELVRDPRVTTSDEDFAEQFGLLSEIQSKLSEVATSVNEVRTLRSQIDDWTKRLADRDDAAMVLEAAAELRERLTEVENELVQVEFTSEGDSLNYREKLFEKLGALTPVVASADRRPTRQSHEVFAKLAGQIDEQLARLRSLVDDDLAAVNGRLADIGVDVIGV